MGGEGWKVKSATKEEYKTSSFRHCFQEFVFRIPLNALIFPEVIKRCCPENSMFVHAPEGPLSFEKNL